MWLMQQGIAHPQAVQGSNTHVQGPKPFAGPSSDLFLYRALDDPDEIGLCLSLNLEHTPFPDLSLCPTSVAADSPQQRVVTHGEYFPVHKPMGGGGVIFSKSPQCQKC